MRVRFFGLVIMAASASSSCGQSNSSKAPVGIGPQEGGSSSGADAATLSGADAATISGADAATISGVDGATSRVDGATLSDGAVLQAVCTSQDAGPVGSPPVLTTGQWVDISPPGLNRPRASTPPYGCMDIHVSPCNPNVLYLTTDSEGMWFSQNAGGSWKQIGNLQTPVSPGDMQIDPTNPLHMYYVGGVRGSSLGFWVSNDGGNTWTQPTGFSSKADNSADGWTNDAYDVKADPSNFNHVLVTFHSPWNWTNAPGVLESKDGGMTWTRRMPGANWGAGDSVYFLGNSTTWLVGTQSDGFWRTTDSGSTWTQVSTVDMQHGGTSSYVSKAGVLYVGALSNILRSTDDGLTFTPVGPHTADGYYAVVGDGNFLYAQFGNTGANGVNTDQPYIVSPESDGTNWTNYNSQVFSDGPYRMAFDSVNRIIYSANWNAGVWALKVK